MTELDRPQVLIRTPLVARIVSGVMAVFGVAFIGGGLVVSGVREHNWGALLFSAAFLAMWLTIVVRTSGMAVRSTPDGRLVVRNQLRTTTYDRSQIEDVRRSAGGVFSPGQGALQLLLTDGTVQGLQVTMAGPIGLGRRRSEAQLDVLRRWLRGS